MKTKLLLFFAVVAAQAQLAPVRVIDGNWKTTALRSDNGAVYITSERGVLKAQNGTTTVLKTAPLWAADVTRDNPGFKCMGMKVVSSSSARMKTCIDGTSAVFPRTGAVLQPRFTSKNTAVLAQVDKPLVRCGATRQKGCLDAPAGLAIGKPKVLNVTLDRKNGTDVLVLYAAVLKGDTMVVERFKNSAGTYKRAGEYLVRIPGPFKQVPHMAAWGESLWLGGGFSNSSNGAPKGNEDSLVAEYRLVTQ